MKFYMKQTIYTIPNLSYDWKYKFCKLLRQFPSIIDILITNDEIKE